MLRHMKKENKWKYMSFWLQQQLSVRLPFQPLLEERELRKVQYLRGGLAQYNKLLQLGKLVCIQSRSRHIALLELSMHVNEQANDAHAHCKKFHSAT